MDYVYTLVILACLAIILAIGFNLILGYAGLISVAHPIFFAIGAYTSGMTAIHTEIPIVICIALGAAAAALASVALSLPSLRVSGDYLMIASIGFQLGLLQVINNLEFTGAAGGLTNIPSLVEAGDRGLIFSGIVLLMACLVFYGVKVIVDGDYGRAIRAMRDDETAFVALGRNAMTIKVVIFAAGSGLAGLAGAMYAHYFLYITPEQFGIFYSATLLTMVVVGGAGTKWGPVIGALVLTALPQLITFLDLPSATMGPIQGLIFTSLVLFFIFMRPQGIAGWWSRRPPGAGLPGKAGEA